MPAVAWTRAWAASVACRVACAWAVEVSQDCAGLMAVAPFCTGWMPWGCWPRQVSRPSGSASRMAVKQTRAIKAGRQRRRRVRRMDCCTGCIGCAGGGDVDAASFEAVPAFSEGVTTSGMMGGRCRVSSAWRVSSRTRVTAGALSCANTNCSTGVVPDGSSEVMSAALEAGGAFFVWERSCCRAFQ